MSLYFSVLSEAKQELFLVSKPVASLQAQWNSTIGSLSNDDDDDAAEDDA